ncbi:MAG: hypothetical protein DLM62_19205 [Pseudonocardiales bacterium]|nr:MAG: hypothetical protein DLM62_19205 [Pseudonocardiales bacterium]
MIRPNILHRSSGLLGCPHAARGVPADLQHNPARRVRAGRPAEAVRQWAKAHGHRIIAEYVDAGVSGATDAVDRPGLSDAVEQIGRPSHADGIIAARLDRLARALTVQEAILALCWREGARVFTADTGEVLRDDAHQQQREPAPQATDVPHVPHVPQPPKRPSHQARCKIQYR